MSYFELDQCVKPFLVLVSFNDARGLHCSDSLMDVVVDVILQDAVHGFAVVSVRVVGQRCTGHAPLLQSGEDRRPGSRYSAKFLKARNHTILWTCMRGLTRCSGFACNCMVRTGAVHCRRQF